jgi:hypothetical protein
LTTQTDHMQQLEQAVRRVIDDGSLGVPRFARFVAYSPLSGLTSITANRLAAMSEGWFGSPCAKRSTRRDPTGVSVTELLKWPNGQGAIIVVSSSPPSTGASIDLTLLGSRGVLYHEA